MNACISFSSTPSRAARAGSAQSSASGIEPKRSSACARPAVVPYAPHEDAPTLKTCVAPGANSTSIGTSGAGSRSPRSRPGAETKKSSRWSSPPAVWTSMKPPAPGPVSGDSQTNDISTAATTASTALPPSRSTFAPASAVSGCPAATTPFTRATLCGDDYRLGGRNSGTSTSSMPPRWARALTTRGSRPAVRSTCSRSRSTSRRERRRWSSP